ncbi:probable G-protein coupled receptor 160 [Lampris incognitus]|uniref:probable G-protein coupled receptor 160 n=1 Tax=Lampris incognitus TaxID=2546036 RepID=UPI0024B50B47|nr:probable G-protein coupled receptor 160 [Lampris incognitus]
MHISITSILLGLGSKCLLNWALVLLQRKDVCTTFIGVFSTSLALADTVATLVLTAIHTQGDGQLLGLRVTRYHVCLLVQILGQIYGALHWPVVVITWLDHYWTVSRTLQPITAGARRMACSFVTCLLWSGAVLQVFLLSGFVPVLGDESPLQMQHCWVFPSSQILQVSLVFLSAAVCAALYLYAGSLGPNMSAEQPHPEPQSPGSPARGGVAYQVLLIFSKTWASFFILLWVLLLLPMGIPDYLGLSVPWLCFLNSILIGVVLCACCPAWHAVHSEMIPADIFCNWRLSSVTGDRMGL